MCREYQQRLNYKCNDGGKPCHQDAEAAIAGAAATKPRTPTGEAKHWNEHHEGGGAGELGDVHAVEHTFSWRKVMIQPPARGYEAGASPIRGCWTRSTIALDSAHHHLRVPGKDVRMQYHVPDVPGRNASRPLAAA